MVEIDRSTQSTGKLAPYFRMGVREAWTWSRRDGTAIWTPGGDAAKPVRRAPASRVLRGVTRDALDELFRLPSRSARLPVMRQLARRIARGLAGRDTEAPA